MRAGSPGDPHSAPEVRDTRPKTPFTTPGVDLRRSARLGHRIGQELVQRYQLQQRNYDTDQAAAVVDERRQNNMFDHHRNMASLNDGTFNDVMESGAFHAEILLIGAAARAAGSPSLSPGVLLPYYRELNRDATLYTERRPCNNTNIEGMGAGGCSAYLTRALKADDRVYYSFTTNQQHQQAVGQLQQQHQQQQQQQLQQKGPPPAEQPQEPQVAPVPAQQPPPQPEQQDVVMGGMGEEAAAPQQQQQAALSPSQQITVELADLEDTPESRAQVATRITPIVENVLLAADIQAQPDSWLWWHLHNGNSRQSFATWVGYMDGLVRQHG